MTLSRRIRAFAGVVLFLSVLPAAYLLGVSRGARNAAGNTDDHPAKAAEFQPLERLEYPPKQLNPGKTALVHPNTRKGAQPCPWNVAPAPLGAGLDPGPLAALPGGDPFAQMAQDIQAMQQQMEAMFGTLGTLDPLHGKFRDPFQFPSFGFGARGALEGDVDETGSAYIFRYTLPGLDQASLQVSVDDDMIKVSGSSSQAVGEASNSARFTRLLSLPGPVDSASLKMEYKDEVLTITLKKQVPGTPRKSNAISGASILN